MCEGLESLPSLANAIAKQHRHTRKKRRNKQRKNRTEADRMNGCRAPTGSNPGEPRLVPRNRARSSSGSVCPLCAYARTRYQIPVLWYYYSAVVVLIRRYAATRPRGAGRNGRSGRLSLHCETKCTHQFFWNSPKSNIGNRCLFWHSHFWGGAVLAMPSRPFKWLFDA